MLTGKENKLYQKMRPRVPDIESFFKSKQNIFATTFYQRAQCNLVKRTIVEVAVLRHKLNWVQL
jgi:hypothetical protein